MYATIVMYSTGDAMVGYTPQTTEEKYFSPILEVLCEQIDPKNRDQSIKVMMKAQNLAKLLYLETMHLKNLDAYQLGAVRYHCIFAFRGILRSNPNGDYTDMCRAAVQLGFLSARSEDFQV